MSSALARALAAIDALHDLPRLVSELGHEPLWQELPPMHGARRAAEVGRHGDFTWLGVEAECSAEVLAARIARRLAEEGRVAGVIAYYPAGREIGIGIGFGACGVLRLALDAPSRVTLASLERLRGAGERTATAYAARAEAAVAGRGVGREFFRQFRDTLGALQAAIVGGPRPAADRRALALVQLTRVLFLYFVQSKGWLDGRGDFLPRAVDRCLAHRRGLHRQLLQPLFFGTLNRPRTERSPAVHAFGRIPFLNGGLFEPHALERRYRIGIPDAAWRDAFDRLFERFHFTVGEEDGEGPSIGPDVLGRAFEGVMDPADRKASGTFYTPARLVDEIVAAAIAAHAASRLGCVDAEAAAALGRRDPAALSTLDDVSVLDPACGSGAFLLGALEQLSRLRAPGALPAARRDVLRRNLFGVDLDAMALRLAELRLWLAVVADDPADCPARVRPLPNLDCLIRQGDSLFDPDGLAMGHNADIARQLRTLRARLVGATGAAKRETASALRALERAAALDGCAASERQLEREADALLAAARAPSLFGERGGMSAPMRARVRDIRSALSRTRAARRRLLREDGVPWFHYASHFADVLERGGFDVVLGNPPWVRAEELAPELRARLAERYRWWRGSPVRSGYAHRPDLSVAFLERAHELACPGGAVAMLVPAKLAAAGYAAAARAAIAARTTIHAIADLTGDPRAAFDATVYPMALVTTRRQPASAHKVRAALAPASSAGIPQRELGSGPWVLSGGITRIIERLCRAHQALGERHRCRLGVKTGADDVFLDPPAVEPELLRWAVRGRDVRPFAVEPKRRLLWTHDRHGAPLRELPELAARHLAARASTLRGRADYAGGPIWTLYRTDAAVAVHKVVWRDLSRTIAASVITGPGAAELVPLNTCYWTRTQGATEAHALAAWLNSTWIRGIARATAAPASGGFSRYTASTMSALPAPPTPAEPVLHALGREAAAGGDVQARLDRHVASLLSLSGADLDVLAAVAGSAPDRR